jgi:short-subunit dehydrogenase
MLVKDILFKDVVLIGSNSDIGISIINRIQLANGANVHLIGRRTLMQGTIKNSNINLIFHKCDLSNITEVTNFLYSLTKFEKSELVILSAGVLPEENSEYNLSRLKETFTVNTVASIMFLSRFAEIMNENKGGKILVCSSVASIRPRLKNFSYGASKSALDFYAVGLQNKLRKSKVKVLILRPGYVFTKMTTNFKPAPFAIELDTLAKIAINGLIKNKKVIYAPSKLKIIMNIFKFIPRHMFNRLG